MWLIDPGVRAGCGGKGSGGSCSNGYIAGSLSHSVAEIKGALEGKWGKTYKGDRGYQGDRHLLHYNMYIHVLV